MKHCKYCNVDVSTTENYCPLCYNTLEGENNGTIDFYQKRRENETKHKTRYLIYKIFLLISIAIISTCIFINVITYESAPTLWSLLVGVCVVYLWILVPHTIISKRSIFEKILFELIGAISIVYVCNILSNGTWLVEYVLPSMQIATVGVLSMIQLISKEKYRYIFPFFFIYAILFVTSIIMVATKVDTFGLINEINMILSGIAIVGTLIFGHKTLKTEISKKFHL